MGSLRLGEQANIKTILGITDTSQDTFLDILNSQISVFVEQFVLGENVVGLRWGGGPPPDNLVEFHDGGIDAVVTRRNITTDATFRDAVEVTEDGVVLVVDVGWQLDAHPSRTIRRRAPQLETPAMARAGDRP